MKTAYDLEYTKLVSCLFLALVVAVAALALPAAAGERLSLGGEWRFALDESKEGASKEWYKTSLPDVIRLPGTTDEAKKGKPNLRTNEVMHLSRPFAYSGPA